MYELYPLQIGKIYTLKESILGTTSGDEDPIVEISVVSSNFLLPLVLDSFCV